MNVKISYQFRKLDEQSARFFQTPTNSVPVSNFLDGVEGFVGEGLLSAAVSGSIFASPPAGHILAAIRAANSSDNGTTLYIHQKFNPSSFLSLNLIYCYFSWGIVNSHQLHR